MTDKRMQVLIDADSIYFRIAMATQREKDMRVNLRKTLMDIEDKCSVIEPVDMRIAVKGKGNFRTGIAPAMGGDTMQFGQFDTTCGAKGR